MDFFKRYRNYLLMHFVIFIWGFTGLMGKMIAIPAVNMVWYRTLFAFIALLLFAVVRGKNIAFGSLNKKKIMQLLLISLIISTHWILFFEAIKQSNISIGVVCLSTSSFFVALLQPLFFKEKKIRWVEILMSLFVIFGLLIIFQVETSFHLGIILGIIAAFLGANFSIFNAHFTKDIAADLASSTQMGFSFLIISVYMLLQGTLSPAIFDLSLYDFSLLLFLGIVATAFPIFVTVLILRTISPFSFAVSVNLEPIYSIILALLFFTQEEKMNVNFYIGFFIILCTILFDVYLQRKNIATEKI